MQPPFAVLQGRAGFLRFVGAALGFVLGLAQLGFHVLPLPDVDEQALPFFRERDLMLALHRDVSEGTEHAGQRAVLPALRVRAVLDGHEMAILGDHAGVAVHISTGAGAGQRNLQRVAIIRVNQREAGSALQLVEGVAQQDAQAAGR